MKKNIFVSSLLVSILAAVPSVSFAANTATLIGTTANDKYGKSVATGDFNGDGYQDMVVGSSGGSYITVTYGASTVLPSLTVSATNTAKITGGSSTDSFGISVATGDINNDGYDDIIVGASTSSSNTGAAYIIYGKATQLTSEAVESDALNIKFTGTGDLLGNAVAMGDVNGDGFDDIVVGGKNNGISFATAGAFFVVYGRTAAFSNGSMASTANIQFTGEAAADKLGSSLAVGDLNGDGFADIAAGSPTNDDVPSDAGAVYIVYGSGTNLSGSSSISASPELTGEVTGDGAGTTGSLAISTGSINGDDYNDLLVGSPNNDDGASNAGAVYVVPGSATLYTGTTSLGSSSFVEITNTTATAGMPTGVTSTDLNLDGFSDLVIGASVVNSSAGAVYVIPGTTALNGISLATATEFNGASTTDSLGTSVATGDLNGDTFPELLMGAIGYSAGASTGEVVIDYPYIDADLDGVPGTDGLFSTISATNFNANVTFDCSDTDATVSANQTYYADADADTLGDPATTTSVCASTAPTGYVDNSNDTNDTIPNNGVEIGGDNVDNDGDGSIDEVNTVAENGVHPYYSLQDVTDATTVVTNVTSLAGIAAGMVEVTYADGSVYDYPVYTSSSTKDTNLAQYEDTADGIVLHKAGKKVYLVNLYTGDVTDKVTIKKTGFTSSAMLMKDLRSNNKSEVVVTGKTKAKVMLAIVKVNVTSGNLTLSDSVNVTDKHVSVTKTKATSTKIKLRSATSKVLEIFNVTKAYNLVVL